MAPKPSASSSLRGCAAKRLQTLKPIAEARRIVPRKLVDPSRIADLPVVETGMEGAYAFLRLTDGLIAGANSRLVDCLTGDQIVEHHGLDRVDYLNIQVNGAELEVLKGATQSLDRIRVIGLNCKYSVGGETRQADIVQ